MIKYFLAAAYMLVAAGMASADCVIDGHNYPEDSRVGDYVCKEGEWRKADSDS